MRYWNNPNAAGIPSSANGNLSSTNVQNALDELANKADINPRSQFSLYDPLTWANQTQNVPLGPFGLVAGQNAGGNVTGTGNYTQPVANRLGLIAFDAGTSNNNTGGSFCFSDTFSVYPGEAASFSLEFAAMLPTLADATNDFQVELGFQNTPTNGAAANSMTFRYKRADSTNWQAVTANNSTETVITTADTTFAVTAGQWMNFKISVAAGTVSFYMAAPGNEYSLLGTSTTNLPDLTHSTYLNFRIWKLSTFAVRRMFILDWIKFDMTFNSLS